MNPFDVVIIIVVSFCLIRGFFRGLIKEISSIIGVFAGYYASYTYYIELSQILSKWISTPSYLNILSFLLIFCGVFIAISLLGSLIKYLLNIAFLGWLDRVFGALFGLTKAVLITSIFLVILTIFLPKDSELLKTSLLSPYVSIFSENMIKLVPKDMKEKFGAKMEDIKKIWKSPTQPVQPPQQTQLPKKT